jgi:hypothetical protein
MYTLQIARSLLRVLFGLFGVGSPRRESPLVAWPATRGAALAPGVSVSWQGASAASLLALAACTYACTRGGDAAPSAEEALLSRRVAGLKRLVARASAGPLVQQHPVTVVVHQDVVRDLVVAATPFERTILGRYRVRVDSAAAEFEDGFALVRLAGRVALVGPPAFADVVVLGGLEVAGLEDSGLLRCEVKVLAVEAMTANVAGLDRPARELIRRFGRDALDALISVVDVPVKVENRLVIPRLDVGRVRIEAASIPMRARVVDVLVFEERLWVGLTVAAGEGLPGEEGS